MKNVVPIKKGKYQKPIVRIHLMITESMMLSGSDESIPVVNNAEWPVDPITNQPVRPW